MHEPIVLPIVAKTTTTQNDHGPRVSGSIWLGSETRKPAYGRISSEGSGIIADSIAIAIITPRYPTAPYSEFRNGMTIWSIKASTAASAGGSGTAPRLGRGIAGRISDYPANRDRPEGHR